MQRHPLHASVALFSARQNLRLLVSALLVAESAALTSAMVLMRSHSHWVRAALHVVKGHHLALVALALVILSGLILADLSSIVLVKAPVSNAKNALAVAERLIPGFVTQDRSSKALAEFRQHLYQLPASTLQDELSTVSAINHWVRSRQSQDKVMWRPPFVDLENPLHLLQQQSFGLPGACRRFSFILLGVLLSAGFHARIVCFSGSLRRWGTRQHVAVEVWIEALGKWVLLDPTHDCMITLSAAPLSATELCDLIFKGRTEGVTVLRNENALDPKVKIDFYLKCCRHCFIGMSNAVFDGYAVRPWGPKRIAFVHYSPTLTYPKIRKQLLIWGGAATSFLSLLTGTCFLLLLLLPLA